MRIKKLEAIRGFSALYVVVHHFANFTILKSTLPPLVRLPFRFGPEAVILFFFMSGFVIYMSVAKSKELTFSKYFIRRAIRIYPIAIVTFILSITILYLNHKQLESTDYKTLLCNLFMLQDTGGKGKNISDVFLGN